MVDHHQWNTHIDTLIASGYPHLEEAYRVAELMFPLLDLSSTDAARRAPPAGPSLMTGGGSFMTTDGFPAPRFPQMAQPD